MEKINSHPLPRWADPNVQIPIVVSACLLGQQVRYDGDHRRDSFLVRVLSQWVEWRPVCPEVELGLGVPRPTIQLEQHPEGIRLRQPETGLDLTERMQRFVAARVQQPDLQQVCGAILKARSPSCGVRRVKLLDPSGQQVGWTQGFFAAALVRAFPFLPVEEDEHLHDGVRRHNWVRRVVCLHRLQRLCEGPWTYDDLLQFHQAHRWILSVHHPAALIDLDSLVAHAEEKSQEELQQAYTQHFLRALSRPATRPRHVRVLRKFLEMVSEGGDPILRRETLEAIEGYHRGQIPLVVPVTFVRAYLRHSASPELAETLYLNPHPMELKMAYTV